MEGNRELSALGLRRYLTTFLVFQLLEASGCSCITKGLPNSYKDARLGTELFKELSRVKHNPK